MLKKYPALLIGRGKLQSKVYKVYFFATSPILPTVEFRENVNTDPICDYFTNRISRYFGSVQI